MIITVNTDGGSRGNPGKSACAYVIDANGQVYEEGFYLGIMTNNQAEYWGLIKALEFIVSHFSKQDTNVNAYADSLLVVNQIRGLYKVKNGGLKSLHAKAKELISQCNGFTIKHVRREANVQSDKILNQILDSEE